MANTFEVTGTVGGRFYGDGGTTHLNTDLDIEVMDGSVVSVWYRCQMLPFKVTQVERVRAREMRGAYARGPMPAINGMYLEDSDG